MYHLFVNSCQLHDKDDLENTNNIILPMTILSELDHTSHIYFKLTNIELNLETYCSVQEFTAPEETVIMPIWLMEYLGLHEMSIITLELIDQLRNGLFIRLEPQEKEFFKVPDNDKWLEKSLSRFSLLHDNLIFRCNIDGRPMSFLVKDVEGSETSLDLPEGVIAITNRDINLDIVNKFPDTPPPTPPPTPKIVPMVSPIDNEFKPFVGTGQILGTSNKPFDREEWLKKLENKN